MVLCDECSSSPMLFNAQPHSHFCLYLCCVCLFVSTLVSGSDDDSDSDSDSDGEVMGPLLTGDLERDRAALSRVTMGGSGNTCAQVYTRF